MERNTIGKGFGFLALIAMCYLTARIGWSTQLTVKAQTTPTEVETVAEETQEERVIVIETEVKTPKVATQTEVKKKWYTDEDLYYLTCVLTGECQCFGWEHQVAVGSVVLNRLNSPDWTGNTVKEVCLAKDGGYRQYSCFYDGNAYREQTELSKQVAKWLLDNGSQLPSNVVYQSQGKQGHGVYKKIDCHYFCYQ